VREGGEVVSPLGERVLGRSAAEDVIDPATEQVLVKAGEMIEEDAVAAIEAADLEAIKIRSALTCETRNGVCASCYGRDLARGTPVNVGEAVGVIAAQSIGEPGTQLTMRTFHIGGAVQRGAEQSKIEAVTDGTATLRNCSTVRNSAGIPVVMNRNAEAILVDTQGRERARHRLAYGT
jgi:DNA-directed RNA polymerase subunit beta'